MPAPDARLEYLGEKRIEGGPAVGVDQDGEAFTDQARALESQEARSREIGLTDLALPTQGQVADRGEFVEIREAGKTFLHLAPGPFQLLVLQLQLNLVDLQLVKKPAGFWRHVRITRAGIGPAYIESLFGSAPQLAGAFRVALGLLHGYSGKDSSGRRPPSAGDPTL
jgi:hypothetical protein